MRIGSIYGVVFLKNWRYNYNHTDMKINGENIGEMFHDEKVMKKSHYFMFAELK